MGDEVSDGENRNKLAQIHFGRGRVGETTEREHRKGGE